MPRNLDHRVEALVPIQQPAVTARLEEILAANLADDRLAWALGPDGRWRKLPGERGVDAQKRFQELALSRALSPGARSAV